MSTLRTIDVRLKMQGELETDAKATLEDWDTLDRARRAVIALAICWACGGIVLFIFIPIVHLVASGTLLVLGPVLFFMRFLQQTSLKAVEGQCPRCKAPGKFSFGKRYKSPKNINCDTCGNLMELTAK
jgi:hypothetical protein